MSKFMTIKVNRWTPRRLCAFPCCLMTWERPHRLGAQVPAYTRRHSHEIGLSLTAGLLFRQQLFEPIHRLVASLLHITLHHVVAVFYALKDGSGS